MPAAYPPCPVCHPRIVAKNGQLFAMAASIIWLPKMVKIIFVNMAHVTHVSGVVLAK